MIKVRIFFYLLLISLLNGCRIHRQHRLELLQQETISTFKHSQKNDITCSFRALSSAESNDILGADISAYGFTPCLLEFKNNSPKTYYFNARYISAPLASDEFVKEYLYWPTYSFACTTSLLSLVYFWPAIPIMVIPGSYWLSSQNRELDIFLREYSVKAQERSFVILPYENFKKLCFIYGLESYVSFDIGLLTEHNEFIKFNVSL